MDSIVIFGKGGIGKSTIAANISTILGLSGRKVLHVGCDPKMDSTLALMGRRIPPYSVICGEGGGPGLRDGVFRSRIKNVMCAEAGGPEPGVGCAGAAIGSLLDAFREENYFQKQGFDSVIFDVLGDVVCGGFAAPLRKGFAKKAVIVSSEETLSLYAANNLLKMLNNYARNGVFAAGMILNVRDPEGIRRAEKFAGAVNLKILGTVLRDRLVSEAELKRVPAAIEFPKSDFAKRMVRICGELARAAERPERPEPFNDEDFSSFFSGVKQETRKRDILPTEKKILSSADLKKAGFRLSGIDGGRVLCDWKTPEFGLMKTMFVPQAEAREDMYRFSDWAVCVIPENGRKQPEGSNRALYRAAEKLAFAGFKDFLSLFAGKGNTYEVLSAICGKGDTTVSAPHTLPIPDIGINNWHKFIFPIENSTGAAPGTPMLELGDAECRFSGGAGGRLGFFAPVSADENKTAPSLPTSGPCSGSTDFDLDDALSGSNAVYRDYLEKAADIAGPGGLVDVCIGCSPILLTPDFNAEAEDIAAEKKVGIAVEDHNNFYNGDPRRLAKHVPYAAKKLREAVEKEDKVYDVCLTGFSSAALIKETLAVRGIKAAVSSEDNFYQTAARARLQLTADRNSIYYSIFEKAGLEQICEAQPYGFVNTDMWLGKICSRLGKKFRGADEEEKKEAEELKKKTEGLKITFITGEGDIDLIAGSARHSGRMLAMSAWAGAKIIFLIKQSGITKFRMPEEIRKLLEKHPPETKFFKDRAELGALLSREKSRLVYSEVRGDARLLRSDRGFRSGSH